jgi:hypothetical protein
VVLASSGLAGCRESTKKKTTWPGGDASAGAVVVRKASNERTEKPAIYRFDLDAMEQIKRDIAIIKQLRKASYEECSVCASRC